MINVRIYDPSPNLFGIISNRWLDEISIEMYNRGLELDISLPFEGELIVGAIFTFNTRKHSSISDLSQIVLCQLSIARIFENDNQVTKLNIDCHYDDLAKQSNILIRVLRR